MVAKSQPVGIRPCKPGCTCQQPQETLPADTKRMLHLIDVVQRSLSGARKAIDELAEIEAKRERAA